MILVPGNRVIEEESDSIAESVTSGEPLGEALERHRLFPPLLGWMARMAEARGNPEGLWPAAVDLSRRKTMEAGERAFFGLEMAFLFTALQVVGTTLTTAYWPLRTIMNSLGG